MSTREIDNLKEHYNSFINSADNWSFFLGVANYVKFILENKRLDKITDEIFIARKNALGKELAECEDQTLKEIRNSHEKILAIIKKNIPEEKMAENPEIKKMLDSFNDFNEGRSFSSEPLSGTLERHLFDIVRNVNEVCGGEKLFTDFIDPNPQHQNIYGNFIFSETLKKRIALLEKMKGLEKIESWGDWDKLCIVYQAVLRSSETLEEIRKTDKSLMGSLGFGLLLQEVEQMRDDRPWKPKHDYIHLVIKEYVGHVSRIHTCLIEEMSKRDSNSDAINEIEIVKTKIMATKPPSFTMRTLRPLSNLIARYTSPGQVCSVLKDFGFPTAADHPSKAETALLQAFEALREDGNDDDIRRIIETFLTLYAQLIDEKLHEKGLIGSVREILRRGHFNIGFHTTRKEYIVAPFEGPVHGAVMYAEKLTEQDFQDTNRRVTRLPQLTDTGTSKGKIVRFKKGDSIKIIEILEGRGRIKLHINEDYHLEPNFARGRYWGKMYELAETGSTDWDKAFFDYFNSNKNNPLYARHGLSVTKILKQEGDAIVPEIKIGLITQKKVTQRRNPA